MYCPTTLKEHRFSLKKRFKAPNLLKTYFRFLSRLSSKTLQKLFPKIPVRLLKCQLFQLQAQIRINVKLLKIKINNRLSKNKCWLLKSKTADSLYCSNNYRNLEAKQQSISLSLRDKRNTLSLQIRASNRKSNSNKWPRSKASPKLTYLLLQLSKAKIRSTCHSR